MVHTNRCPRRGSWDHLIYERLVGNNVLGLTTSGVSKLQLRFLRRFVKRIIMALDMDMAGRKGVKSFSDQHGSDFEIVNLKYNVNGLIAADNKDFGSIWKKLGDDRFKRHISKQML